MNLLKTLLRLPSECACVIGMALAKFVQLVFKRAYFRVTAEAEIHTAHVALAARVGRRVCLCQDVVVRSGVAIGDYTYVNPNAMVESGRVGKFCSIGSGVSIGPFEHPKRLLSTHPATYSEPCWGIIPKAVDFDQKPPPMIGNDVWIGRDAFVMRGVTVGDGAIIGANAVVTKDIPPYAIAVGVPARVVSFRFDPETIDSIIALRYWDDVPMLKSLLERSEPWNGSAIRGIAKEHELVRKVA